MLSTEAVSFLKSQFQRRCSERDGLLPLDLLLEDTGPQSLFYHAPPVANNAEHPLGKQNIRTLLVRAIHTHKLPLESFLCIWAYCALVDAPRAVTAMLYLGYSDTYRRCASHSVAPWHRCNLSGVLEKSTITCAATTTCLQRRNVCNRTFYNVV